VRYPCTFHSLICAYALACDGRYWTKLKKKRDKGDMAGARDALFEEVSQFAHYRGYVYLDC